MAESKLRKAIADKTEWEKRAQTFENTAMLERQKVSVWIKESEQTIKQSAEKEAKLRAEMEATRVAAQRMQTELQTVRSRLAESEVALKNAEVRFQTLNVEAQEKDRQWTMARAEVRKLRDLASRLDSQVVQYQNERRSQARQLEEAAEAKAKFSEQEWMRKQLDEALLEAKKVLHSRDQEILALRDRLQTLEEASRQVESRDLRRYSELQLRKAEIEDMRDVLSNSRELFSVCLEQLALVQIEREKLKENNDTLAQEIKKLKGEYPLKALINEKSGKISQLKRAGELRPESQELIGEWEKLSTRLAAHRLEIEGLLGESRPEGFDEEKQEANEKRAEQARLAALLEPPVMDDSEFEEETGVHLFPASPNAISIDPDALR
jgi:chromosome segregation ATPase